MGRSNSVTPDWAAQAYDASPPELFRSDDTFSRERFRSDDEIAKQLQARLAQMEREAASPKMTRPCRTCHWKKGIGTIYRECHQPLVKGLGSAPMLGTRRTDLCGPEKALWEARKSVVERFVDWFLDPWRNG